MNVGKEEYLAYETVRQSGITNMFDLTTVCAMSGLTREQVREVMTYYSELRNQFGDSDPVS